MINKNRFLGERDMFKKKEIKIEPSLTSTPKEEIERQVELLFEGKDKKRKKELAEDISLYLMLYKKEPKEK